MSSCVTFEEEERKKRKKEESGMNLLLQQLLNSLLIQLNEQGVFDGLSGFRFKLGDLLGLASEGTNESDRSEIFKMKKERKKERKISIPPTINK